MRTNWLKAVVLPIGVLALCSTGNGAVVDCNPLTITCTTFQKGGAKFKPLLTSASGLGTCTTSTPANPRPSRSRARSRSAPPATRT
jgi:hypothetical protein